MHDPAQFFNPDFYYGSSSVHPSPEPNPHEATQHAPNSPAAYAQHTIDQSDNDSDDAIPRGMHQQGDLDVEQLQDGRYNIRLKGNV